MKNPLSTPASRLNQILLQAAVRAERINADRMAEQRAADNARRLDREATQ